VGVSDDDGITQLIVSWQQGDRGAGDDLAGLVYRQLHSAASGRLAREHAAPLQPTELVNEAWLRLAASGQDFASRHHFYATASLQMRHFLVDLARRQASAKRSGAHVTLTVQLEAPGTPPADLATLADALAQLARIDARKADVVCLKELAGLTVPEIADALAVSVPTVERDLRFARAWLASRLA